MNILLLASHAVAEYDDVRMFSDLGYDVFAPGGYEVPSRSGEGIRPALPDAPHHPEFVEMCHAIRAERRDPGPAIDWAKAHIPDPIIDWADVIIAHHFVDRWIGGQWDRIRHKRVIWRTCGQPNPGLERYMTPFVRDGLQVVRYSPRERVHFERAGSFAGEDALIRFGKYPDDYGPWTGELPWVINITQNLRERGDATGYWFWREATRGISRLAGEDGPQPPYAVAIGEGSEDIGGLGRLSYEGMLEVLRQARVYLYTGTRPASYTLGLIEAMLSGIPVVSIGAKAWGAAWGGASLFEAAHVCDFEDPREAGIIRCGETFDDPAEARRLIDDLLRNKARAELIGTAQRGRAIELFGIDTVGRQWQEFLS